MALLCLGALAFVILGVWMLNMDSSELGGRNNDPVTVYGGGAAAVLFFGACLVVGLRQTLSWGPALVLDDEGVMDRVTVFRAGRVPWSDIDRFKLGYAAGQQMLVILLKNPEAYLRRSSSVMGPIHRYNTQHCGSPLVASTHFLKGSGHELRDACEAFRRSHAAPPSHSS